MQAWNAKAYYDEVQAYVKAQQETQELNSRVDFTQKNQELNSRVDSSRIVSRHGTRLEKSPMISKREWQNLVDTLKTFGFSNPKAVINQYGALNSLEAMKRTLHKKPRVLGAYFRTVANNLNKVS